MFRHRFRRYRRDQARHRPEAAPLRPHSPISVVGVRQALEHACLILPGLKQGLGNRSCHCLECLRYIRYLICSSIDFFVRHGERKFALIRPTHALGQCQTSWSTLQNSCNACWNGTLTTFHTGPCCMRIHSCTESVAESILSVFYSQSRTSARASGADPHKLYKIRQNYHVRGISRPSAKKPQTVANVPQHHLACQEVAPGIVGMNNLKRTSWRYGDESSRHSR